MKPGTAFVYLTPFKLRAEQLGGYEFAEVCSELGWFQYCLVPIQPAFAHRIKERRTD